MTQTLEELRDEAISLGLRVHHKHSEDTLREMIALKQNPSKIAQQTITRAEIAQPQIVRLPNYLEKTKPVRVKMRNNQSHELDVLYENISDYEVNGWYVV